MITSLAKLEKMLPLIEAREALVRRISKINTELLKLENGEVSKLDVKPKLAKPRPTHSKTHRGSLQKSVVKALKAAGLRGLKVAVLAQKARVHPPSLRVWLYTSALKFGVVKLAPGIFVHKG